MIALFCLCLALLVSPFESKSRLVAENAALRHQLIILRRKVRGRVRLTVNGGAIKVMGNLKWDVVELSRGALDASDTSPLWTPSGSKTMQNPGARPELTEDHGPLADSELDAVSGGLNTGSNEVAVEGGDSVLQKKQITKFRFEPTSFEFGLSHSITL